MHCRLARSSAPAACSSAQLLHARPDLVMQDIRGNVDTRLRKLQAGDYDALVLAEAGLQRLGLEREITQRLPPSVLLSAVGQGALGLECRAADRATRETLAELDHAATHAAVVAERSMLRALLGGCLAPVAGWARMREADSCDSQASCSARTAVRGSLPSVRAPPRTPKPSAGRWPASLLHKEPRS